MATGADTLGYASSAPRAAVRCGEPWKVQELLAREHVVEDGHFALLGGLHTDRFIAFSRLAGDADALATIAGWLAPSVSAWLPTLLLSPTTAGVSLAAELGRRLTLPVELAAVDDAGRPSHLEGDFVGRRTVIVNDVVTTGVGMSKLAELANGAGATVVGAAWFALRGEIDVSDELGIRECHVVDLDLESWDERDCPLCHLAMPLEQAVDLN